MSMRDNGMLNAPFLRKCERIGYKHPNKIMMHWATRNPTQDEPKFLNGGGLLLPYSHLSSSERDRVDHQAIIDSGFVHVVTTGSETRGGVSRDDRSALQFMLDNDHVMKPWTHQYTITAWSSVFYFTDSTDAVQFRLSRA